MSFIPIAAGIKVGWGGTIATVPQGWLFCNGQAVNRTQFANLFAAISTIWGTGDGSTTFNIPDCRNRVQMGADLDYGCPAKPTSSVIGGNLQCGGSTVHCHSFSGITASHTHSFSGSTDSPSATTCVECYVTYSSRVADAYHTHYYSGTTGSAAGCLSGSTCDATTVPPFAAFPEMIKV